MFTVDGKSYASLDEMPPDVRRAYEQAMGMLADNNQNGLPDVFEGLFNAGNVPTVTGTSAQFVVDGKVYSSVDDLPPDARQKYEQALPRINQVLGDADQNGVADLFENQPAAPPPTRSDNAPNRPLFEEAPTSDFDAGDFGAGDFDAAPKYRTALMFALLAIVMLLLALGVVVGMSMR